MKPSLSNIFNRHARKKAVRAIRIGIRVAAVVALGLMAEDKLRTPGESVLDQIEIMRSDGAEAYPRQLRNPTTPEQKKLAALVEQASSSPTGAMIVGQMLDSGVKMRMEIALNREDACGFYNMGDYNHYLNRMRLNPAERVDDIKKVSVIVHEGRHHTQGKVGADPYILKNIPDHERVILKWLKEADARMASILFAWEQKQQGVPDYYERLRQNGGHHKMVVAFEASLEANPDDMKAAIQAMMRASYDMDNYERSYANTMMSWMERYKVAYSPDEKTYTILHDSLLMRLGDMGQYGNYMDADMMQMIRTSFTPQDFQELARIRQEAGGTKGAACGGKKKPAPVPTS